MTSIVSQHPGLEHPGLQPPARMLQAAPTPETVIDGRPCLYFAGSGYLCLQGHPAVIKAACDAAAMYGVGSATSRTAYGSQPPTLDVERRTSDFLGAQDALYLPNGYLANLTMLSAIAPSYHLLLIDEHAHHSLQAAAQLTGRRVVPFRHRDPASVLTKITQFLSTGGRVLLVTDGVFSVLGTLAPLGNYSEILRAFPGSGILLDDAHGIGVLGRRGRGTWEQAGFASDRINEERVEESSEPALYATATLSKACGGYGGIIAGGRGFIERLKAVSPFYGGTSPLPAPVAAASSKALEIVIEKPELRTRLADNARLLRRGLADLGLATSDSATGDSASPIFPLVLESASRMQEVQKRLAERGLIVAYLARYSGVGRQGVLRLAVFATHTRAMIERLVDELRRLV